MEPSLKTAEQESARIHALIKERVYSQALDEKELHYSHVEKKNNSGIMHNDRTLIVFDREGVGYISKLDEKLILPFQSLARVPKRKTTIPFERIIGLEKKDGSLEIKYRKDDRNKGDPEVWSFRMPNERMLDDWVRIIEACRKPKLSTVTNISQVIPGQRIPESSVGVGDEPVVEKKTEQIQTGPQTTNHMTQTQLKPPTVNPRLSTGPRTNDPSKERPIFGSAINDSKRLDGDRPSHAQVAGSENRGSSLLDSEHKPAPQIIEPFRPTSSVMSFQDKKGQYSFGDNSQIRMSTVKSPVLENTEMLNKDNEIRQTNSRIHTSRKNHDEEPIVVQPEFASTRNEEPGQDWNRLLLEAVDPAELVVRFRQTATDAVANIVDDLGLPLRARKYHPAKPFTTDSDYCEFSVRGLTIILSFSRPKENALSKQPIYDQTPSRQLRNEFDNANHVFLSTENSGRVRVPLGAFIEYRGVIALAKATLRASVEKVSMPSNLQQQFEECTKIHRRVLDENNLRVVEIDGGPSSTFFLDDMAVLLPEDHFSKPFVIINRLSSAFVLRQEFDGQLFSADSKLSQPASRRNGTGNEMKIVTAHSANERLEEQIATLLSEMESLSEVMATSAEMEDLLRERGIPTKYIGLLGQRSAVELVRRICQSEVAARSCAVILRNELQQVIRSGELLGSELVDDRPALIARSKELSLSCLLDLANTILSDSKESDLLWKIVANQSDNDFNCSVERKDITEGYFLQALAHHFGIRVRWHSFNHALEIFRRDVKYFTAENVDAMQAKSTSYDYSFSTAIREVEQLLSEQTEESVSKLIGKLRLRDAPIPEIYELHGIHNKIRVFVSSFLSPQDSSPKSLSLYQHQQMQPLGCCEFKILQNEIRWSMKEPHSDRHNKLAKELTSRIVRWCGEYHPFVIELNQLFSGYYSMKGDHQNAVTMAKSSLASCIKTVGSHSLRTADQYYQLGDVEESCSRREEAIISYRKARAIFENEHRTNTISYGMINSKVAMLDIYYGRMADAETALIKAIDIFQHNRENCEPELSEAVQLLSRCYEIADNKHDMAKLCQQYDRQLHLIKDPLALEKIMKLVVQAKLRQTAKHNKDCALGLVDRLPLRFSQDNYIKGYEELRKLLTQQRSLMRSLHRQLEELEDIMPEILRERLLQDWSGEIPVPGDSAAASAVGFWSALVYFLGQSFVMGCLQLG